MNVTLHPDLGLFPAGTTVKAYKRSALGTVPGSYPAGAPGGTEDTSAAVQTDGTLTFTGLTGRLSYFGYALVSGEHRYFGFNPGAVSPAQPNKLTYDPDTDTVNVEAANFTVDGVAPGGGSSGPTDILVIGTDVELLNGWTVPAPGDHEPVARMYKQGGRVYFYGSVIAPGGSGEPFTVPATHGPYNFSGDGSGERNDSGFAIVKNWNSAVYCEVGAQDLDGTYGFLIMPSPTAGASISLDGVSWAAPA